MDESKDTPPKKEVKEITEKKEKCLMVTCNEKVCFC